MHLKTASLLTFVIYVLACHPEVCQRLENEIEHTMKGRDVPTISDIRNMKYCEFEREAYSLLIYLNSTSGFE